LLCSDDIKEAADLAFGEHVGVIGAARAWSRRLTGRILDQLTDFFFKSHLFEKLIDASLGGWIIEVGIYMRLFRGWRLREGRLRYKNQYGKA
jgi:hypothetical protein